YLDENVANEDQRLGALETLLQGHLLVVEDLVADLAQDALNLKLGAAPGGGEDLAGDAALKLGLLLVGPVEDNRSFWPKEIWSKHVDTWEDLFKPENREKAMQCSSEMVLNALKHAEDCLFYMAGMRDQSCFNFVAIPQSMAIASLELVFRNPRLFDSHLKISKGDACQLMIESTQNLFVVCDIFKRYVRRIHKKNDPRDPNYVPISVQCAKIEQFIDTLYPRQDPEKLTVEQKKKDAKDPSMDPGEAAVLLGITLLTLLFVSGLMIGTAWFFGARFDGLWSGLFGSSQNETYSWPTAGEAVPSAVPSIEHPEL
ncbi:hypothetical protein BN1723_015534, partial [Verticillium longisporum]